MSIKKFACFALMLTLFALAACTPVQPGASPTENPSRPLFSETITLFVGPETADCVGAAPQTCLKVREEPGGEWQLFYDTIEGFTYEPGFSYELKVQKSEQSNSPADGSTYHYELVEVVSKTSGEMTIDLNGTHWDFTGFGKPDGIVLPVEGSNVTLDFNNGQVGGSAGCNGYGAMYTLEGNKIIFNPEGFASTLMYCEPAELMDQETQYLTWLSKGETFTLNNGQLTIHTSEGDLVFKASQTAILETPEWKLSGLVENSGVVSTSMDEKITLKFDNGQITGFAGCNTYFASYTLDGDNLSFGPLGATKMACEQAINDREAKFLAGLQQTASYRIERTSLTLLDVQGNILMSFISLP